MKLSVIIPLYNARQYIGQAIESVLSQEGIEIECIVVDDDSNDNSKEVVNKYPVRYFHKENGGASAARNFGLSHATGEYIMFLDADDFLTDNTICSQCITRIKNEHLDFCLFTYQYYNDETSTLGCSINYDKKWEYFSDADSLLEALVSNGHFPASPCFRILRRSFLESKHLFFKEGTTSEDILWFIKVLIASKRFSLINNNAYKYRKGVTTSVTGNGSIVKCINFTDVLLDCVSLINQVSDRKKKSLLLSALNYEYLILLANSSSYQNSTLLWEKILSLKFLLNYTLFPKTMYLKWFNMAFGLHMTSKALSWYSRGNSRSIV